MHRITSRTLLTVPLLLASGIASAADEVASDYWVRIMPVAWFATLDGENQYAVNGSGDNLQMDDVDLANSELVFGLEASAKLPILVCLHAGMFAFGTEGSFTTAGVDYGGQTMTGQVDATTDLMDVYLEADLRPLDLDLVGVSIGVAYHFLQTEVSLNDGTNSAALDEDLQFPVIALRGHVNLPMLTSLGAEAKIHWMDISYQDNHVSYLDATLQITWRPWEYLGFIGGYRHVVIDVGLHDPPGFNADADLDITLSGPFLGLIGKF